MYLIPAILAFAIWIGLGVDGLMGEVSRHVPRSGWVIGLLFLIYLAGMTFFNWHSVDVSHDQRAELFGGEAMITAPGHAILFTDGDRDVFTLWYFHYGLHERPDIAVIANDLLPFDWYRASLQNNYPDLILPDLDGKPWFTAISEANLARPVCYLYDNDKVEIDCR